MFAFYDCVNYYCYANIYLFLHIIPLYNNTHFSFLNLFVVLACLNSSSYGYISELRRGIPENIKNQEEFEKKENPSIPAIN